MTEKVLYIKHCFQCPYCKDNWRCMKAHRLLKDRSKRRSTMGIGIPDWCPLKDRTKRSSGRGKKRSKITKG